MSAAQRRWLTVWALLLSGLVCLAFLPVSRGVALVSLLVAWGVILALGSLARQPVQGTSVRLDNLPEPAFRQPIVLVCGDVARAWPGQSPVLHAAQGCWIRVEDHQDLEQVAREVLDQRPAWGRQLAVMISVCPQHHADTHALTHRLLALRWQISQLRRKTCHALPVVLQGQAGSAVMRDMLWQAAMPGAGIQVWRESAAPGSVASWVARGGEAAMQQQVMINTLMIWFEQHVTPVLVDENPDVAPVIPAAVVWGMGPALHHSLASSVWTDWLSQRTAIRDAAGWHPATTASAAPLPDFLLPLLPAGRGLTPRQRSGYYALAIFTLAAVSALLCSAWNNRQLVYRVSVDIHRYQRIDMRDYAPKSAALLQLRSDAKLLDNWARNGEPLRMSLGLYQGEHLLLPVLDAIRVYVPPPPPPPPVINNIISGPQAVRLDSMSLFDTGKWQLKSGSTKVLINALVGVKAKPGWLIVVAGHTDSTGDEQSNQQLSLKRAESVRNWMRDTGDVPESCFAVQGYGESRPVATNDTPDGRAHNRRVEISLVPQADACRLPGTQPASQEKRDVSTQEMEK
ncbi:OmpA family protein [Siccibacter colletis]|uniref:OmpA family protein n=1 Tax=Siccibacter colletis TaxID=1505757 RepID=UPI003CED36B4